MERVAVLVAGIAVLSTAAYIFFGPDKLWRKRGRCVGLANLGNTCFINAVLQALASLPSVCEWIDNMNHHFRGRLIRSLQPILSVLSCPEDTVSSSIAPLALLDALRSHQWTIDFHQQDALELYHVLLMTVEEEMVVTNNSLLTDITNSTKEQSQDSLQIQGSALTKCGWTTVPQRLPNCPLKGMLTSTLLCHHCHHHFPQQYEYFDSLSLPISKQFGQVTLLSCLNQYMSANVVSDVHCPKCSAEDKKVVKRTCSKKLSIGRLPECLLIHINRAEWSTDSTVTRNSTPVCFSRTLDVSRFVSNSQRSCCYKLCSVVQHMGGAHSGHYITYRLCGRGWVYTSDTTVYCVTLDEVLNADAYLLLYQRL